MFCPYTVFGICADLHVAYRSYKFWMEADIRIGSVGIPQKGHYGIWHLQCFDSGCALINYVTSVIHCYHNFAKSGSNLLDQDFINMEV